MNTTEQTTPSAAPEKTRVMVVEDDRLVALDLETMLTEFGFATCPTAHSSDEALQNAHRYAPELVLMDIRLEGNTDGVQAAELLQEELGLRVVYLTANSDLRTVERAKRTQPYGYLLKPIRPLDLRCCLELALHQSGLERARKQSVSAGSPEDTPRLSARAPEDALRQPRSVSPLLRALSAREVEVLTMIARGHTSKDIAQALHIAKPTVDTYRGRLTDKLGIRSRAELVSFAARAGLLAKALSPDSFPHE